MLRNVPRACNDHEWRDNISFFNNAEINGHITYIEKGISFTTVFSVSPDKHLYKFVPMTNSPHHTFQFFAELGDSVVKYRFSDTLVLIKNNVKYYYFFEKPK